MSDNYRPPPIPLLSEAVNDFIQEIVILYGDNPETRSALADAIRDLMRRPLPKPPKGTLSVSPK